MSGMPAAAAYLGMQGKSHILILMCTYNVYVNTFNYVNMLYFHFLCTLLLTLTVLLTHIYLY